MHPSYWFGIITISIATIFLSLRKSKPIFYLNIVILCVLYINLPVVALIEYPMDRIHLYHTKLAFYIIKGGTIDPSYNPTPETAALQLLISLFNIVVAPPDPLLMIEYAFILIAPLLIALSTYLIIKKLSNNNYILATLAAISCLVLANNLYLLSRMIYALVLFTILILIMFSMLMSGKKDVRYTILSIVIMTALTLGDPAHMPVFIASLIIFILLASILHLLSVSFINISIGIFTLLSIIIYFSWYGIGYARFLFNVILEYWQWFTEQVVQEIFHIYPGITVRYRAEFVPVTWRPELEFWNIIKVASVMAFTALAILCFSYVFIKKRKLISNTYTYALSLFIVTALLAITGVYYNVLPLGISIVIFYSLVLILGSASVKRRKLFLIFTSFVLLTFSITIQGTYVRSTWDNGLPRVRISSYYFIDKYTPQEMLVGYLGTGRTAEDFIYMTSGRILQIQSYDELRYLVRENLKTLDTLTNYKIVVISDDLLIFDALYIGEVPAAGVINYTIRNLNENLYNLIYSSEYPLLVFAKS
jgi:hypothetical protein